MIFKLNPEFCQKIAAVDSHTYDWDWKKRKHLVKKDFGTNNFKVQTILMSFRSWTYSYIVERKNRGWY